MLPVFCVFGCSFVLCIMVFCCPTLGVSCFLFCSRASLLLHSWFHAPGSSLRLSCISCFTLIVGVLCQCPQLCSLAALSHVINRSHVAVFLFLSIFSAFPSFPSPVVRLSSCMSSQVFLCRRFLVSDFFVLFVSFFVFHTVTFSCPSLRLC